MTMVFDLAHHVGEIIAAPIARLWSRTRASKSDPKPSSVSETIVRRAIEASALRRLQKRLARQHGWKWQRPNHFAGRLDNGAPWEASLRAEEVGRHSLTWVGSHLACRTERMLIVSARTGRSPTASTAVRRAGMSIDDPALVEMAVADPCIRKQYALLCDDPEFGRVTRLESVLAGLLSADRVVAESISIQLMCNRLTISGQMQNGELIDIEGFIQAAIALAENANASNGRAYLNQRSY